MFPDARVLQDVACLMIIKPVSDDGAESIPFISMCTPGMVGSFAGVNSKKIGIGTDMLLTGACSQKRPGFNEELLLRWVLEKATDIDSAVDIIAEAQRGVSAIYFLGDGESDRACVLETIRKLECKNVEQLADYFHDFLPARFKKCVPDMKAFLVDQLTAIEQTKEFDLLSKGVGIRWTDYQYPVEFHEKFDRKLWDCNFLGKEYQIPYEEEYFTDEHGFFNHHPKGSVCPGMHYFPPQREQLDNLVLCTNHAIVPYIRLCEMDSRTGLLAGRHINDIQWRYDALNDLILKKVENLAPGESLDEEAVKELIDFLAPLPDDVSNAITTVASAAETPGRSPLRAVLR